MTDDENDGREDHSPIWAMVLERILENLSESASDEEQSDAVAAAIDAAVNDLPPVLYRAFKTHARKGLRAEDGRRRGFERRNQKRWKGCFDLLEMMLVCSTETAGHVSALYGAKAEADDDLGFPAIKHLHAKGLLVAREALHLCRGGFADGALARWRSLHEAVVAAVFINSSSKEIARRYLASFDYRALAAAIQLNRYAERANLSPFSEDELEAMRMRRDSHSGLNGEKLGKDYEWARPALTVSPNRPITLLDLEESVGLDHWRPRYRWASQHTHAGYRPLNNTLGESESQEPVFLVGQSNSGMVDPLQMTALSLCILDSAFFLRYPDVDRITFVKVQSLAADEIGSLGLALQNDSFVVAQKRAKLREKLSRITTILPVGLRRRFRLD